MAVLDKNTLVHNRDQTSSNYVTTSDQTHPALPRSVIGVLMLEMTSKMRS